MSTTEIDLFEVQQALRHKTYTVEYQTSDFSEYVTTPKGRAWTTLPVMKIAFHVGDFFTSTRMPLDEFRKLGEEAGKAKLLKDVLYIVRAFIRPHVSPEAIMERRANLMRQIADVDAQLVEAVIAAKGDAA